MRPTQRSGIYRGECVLEALMGRAFPVAGDGWLQATLTAMGIRIMCFTIRVRVRQRSGISTITFTSAAATGQLFRTAGHWSVQRILIATAILIMCLSTSRARPQSGIYRGERLLEALMADRSQRVGMGRDSRP